VDSNLILLFGRARALVLNALYRAETEGVALHLRELARRTALSLSAVQYELGLLRQIELIRDIGTTNRPAYVLNQEHVLYEGLANLFMQTQVGLLADDAHFARKRMRQRQDRREVSEANSALLAKHKK
jgi:hypothetical protein